MAFIEWVDALVVEEKPATEEKPAKRKETEPAAKQKEAEAPEAAPAAKKEAAAEPKPKKRKWFGKKSDDAAK
jgi:hypothetical protein